jgi:hypothetical protein
MSQPFLRTPERPCHSYRKLRTPPVPPHSKESQIVLILAAAGRGPRQVVRRRFWKTRLAVSAARTGDL